MEMIEHVGSVMAVSSISQSIGSVFSGSLAGEVGIRTMFYATAVFRALIARVRYFFLPQAIHEKSGATA